MLSLLLFWIGALIRLFRSRGNLVLENLMLRQQLAVLKRRHPRPSLGPFDKLFWVIARRVIARRVWSTWKESLIIVTPETVVRWHRTGFRVYWRWISRVRRPVGRRRTPKEVRKLILRMVVENPTYADSLQESLAGRSSNSVQSRHNQRPSKTNGDKRFLWAFVAARYVVYTVAATRSSEVLKLTAVGEVEERLLTLSK